jgi:parallel beta-helix repeat protein
VVRVYIKMKKTLIFSCIAIILILSVSAMAKNPFEDLLEEIGEKTITKVGTIDDSNAIHHFPHFNRINNIQIEINSKEDFVQTETSNVNKIITNYHSKSLNIQSIYEKIDSGRFTTNKPPIKQAYVLTNNLNKKQKVTFTINHEINAEKVTWDSKEYQIKKKQKYFEAYSIEHRLSPEKTDLAGHVLYFEDVYYDFEDITNLNYKVYTHSKDNKNYISIEIKKTLKPNEEFLIDPTIGWGSNNIAEDPVIWGPTSAHSADLDGDGDLDLVTTAWNGINDRVIWFENDGNYPINWTDHVISTNVDKPTSIHSADLDGDGDLDLVSALEGDGRVEWYENDGNYPINWFTRTITDSAYGAEYVHSTDLDQDGDMDVIAAISGEDRVAWYENDGNSTPSWTKRNITTNAFGPWALHAGDIDNDNDIDIVVAARFADEIIWFENDGTSRSWIRRVVAQNINGPWSIYTEDLDKDGDLDIIGAFDLDDSVIWFENDGNIVPSWIRNDISTTMDAATSARPADIDDDGDLDIVSGSHDDKKISWFENTNGRGTSWAEQFVASTSGSGGPIWTEPADFDNDNDIDILGASGYYTGSLVAWYESNFTQTPTNCGPIYEDLVLRNNVSSASTCFSIKKHQITLDCNGYTISGSGINYGVAIQGKKEVTIRNCNIENYRIGIAAKRTRYAAIMDNTITDNRAGIYIEESENDTILDNVVEDNIVFGMFFRPNTQFHGAVTNRFCYNGLYDVAQVAAIPSNTGTGNTCTSPYQWTDIGMSNSCTFQCV